MPPKSTGGEGRTKWQLSGKTRLQQVWVWNDSVTEFIRSRLQGYSLNICAGKNPLCSVNIDLDPADRSILKGDMRLLPFETDTFDTVISDPPWKIGYYERFRPFFEAVRVCKVGGTIIYNAYWIPMCPSGDVSEPETWLRQDKNFTNTSVISIFKKVKRNPAYEAQITAEKESEK